MPSFSTSRRVPFSTTEMFALVSDVERYPEFLPLCEGLVIRRREPAAEGDVLIADMTAGYKSFRETFTSRVTLRPRQSRIDVAYIDGPFRSLDNTWLFRDAGQGSEISFHITYELKSQMLALLVGAVFDKAFRKFAEAFEARAAVVYGKGGAKAVRAIPV
jgi:coenzyme Q-binding protein COQ10